MHTAKAPFQEVMGAVVELTMVMVQSKLDCIHSRYRELHCFTNVIFVALTIHSLITSSLHRIQKGHKTAII
jgi:hypothetical protein